MNQTRFKMVANACQSRMRHVGVKYKTHLPGEDYGLPFIGVDVGGTFTELLLIYEETGATFTAKVASTPQDSSIAVLNGIARICTE